MERDRWIAHWEATAVRLAAAIASPKGPWFKRSFDLNPDRAGEMIHECRSSWRPAPDLVRLHGDDAALLGGACRRRSSQSFRPAEKPKSSPMIAYRAAAV